MLTILSPAKTMNMSPSTFRIPETEPIYKAEAEFLAEKMRHCTIAELEKSLKISNPLAENTYQRYQEFDLPATPSKQALLAYNGSVFKTIQPATFSAADFSYAQDHLRILSTLYGLVRPFDLIKAYRIAFHLKPDGMGGKNLYDFWLPKLTAPLIEDVRKSGGILINLASLDVWAALNTAQLSKEVKIITPEFQEYRDGKYETVRTYAKLARGAMTRYIIKNRIESPSKLQEFNFEGFIFNPELSDDNKFMFTRLGRNARY